MSMRVFFPPLSWMGDEEEGRGKQERTLLAQYYLCKRVIRETRNIFFKSL